MNKKTKKEAGKTILHKIETSLTHIGDHYYKEWKDKKDRGDAKLTIAAYRQIINLNTLK